MIWLTSALLVLPIAPLALGVPNAIGSGTLPYSYRAHLQARDEQEYPWAALGDSFASGPGAGEPYNDLPDDQCFRSKGAYPPQLAKDFPFPSRGDEDMQFLACGGDAVESMINERLNDMEEDQQVVTLSIGGNDVKFGKVLRACVFKPAGPASDDCQTIIDEAQEIIDNKIEGILRKAFDAIFAKLDSDYKRIVVVQLYPNFFAENDDWCKDQTLGLIPGFQPPLIKDLQHRLNFLSESLRGKMKGTIIRYVRDRKEPPHDRGSWPVNRLFYNDEFDEDTYPGHRFCEPGKKTFDDESIWFFIPGGNDSPTAEANGTSNTTAGEISANYDASTCKDNPKYDTDGVFGWGCDLSLYIAADNITSSTTMFVPGTFVKAFHPKTVAFTEIYKQHKEWLPRIAYPRSQNVDQGILTCKIQHNDGDKEFYFSRENALQAIQDFCVGSHTDLVTVGSDSRNETSDGGITVGYYQDLHKPKSCPVFDQTADDFVAMCKERLGVAIENCDKQKRSSDAWKQGGLFYRDCVTWSIGRSDAYEDLPVNAPDNSTVSSMFRRTEMPRARIQSHD